MTPEYRKRAEKRITEYLQGQGFENIKNMQVEETFDDLESEVHVWNVKTDQGSWWVVQGDYVPMNLYTQGEFYFSADEAYSFHIGITDRLEQRRRNNFKHIIDELPLDIDKVKSIKRNLTNIGQQLNNTSLSSEEVQQIGLTCRESLIQLGNELTKKNAGILEKNNLKASDFKGIAKEVIKIYASGKSNKSIRKYARSISEMAWNYSSELVHSKSRHVPDAKLSLLFTSSAVSVFENLYLKYLGFDHEEDCPECKSRNYTITVSENKSEHLFECQDCGYKKVFEVEYNEK